MIEPNRRQQIEPPGALSQAVNCAALAVTKLALTAFIPIQRWVTPVHTTHAFINRQAIEILRNDGHRAAASLLESNFDTWNGGTYWADKGWKNTTHHFNPSTGRGLWRWPDALVVCSQYWENALRFWQQGAQEAALFWLGAVGHIIQDLCEPHHARATALHGHRVFEAWAEDVKGSYALSAGGIYGFGETPVKWAKANAETAWEFFPLVTDKASTHEYHQAAGVLLPRAQATTAGLAVAFLEIAGVPA